MNIIFFHMGLKNFIQKICYEEEDSLEVILALSDTINKLEQALYRADGKTFFNIKTLATNLGKLLIFNSNNEKQIKSYLKTLNKSELWQEFNRVYFFKEMSISEYFEVPDADHPKIFYITDPSEYMFLVQKEIFSGRFREKS